MYTKFFIIKPGSMMKLKNLVNMYKYAFIHAFNHTSACARYPFTDRPQRGGRAAVFL